MDPAYINYIRSEKWQLKRQAWFDRNGRYCRACGTTRGPIELNHRTYERLGRERFSDLVAMCRPCHNSLTKYHRRNRRRGLEENTDFIIAAIKAGRIRPGD